MEYRKLISFGKNSFVISLPKAWIRQNKLKKGDLINVEENGTNLVLSLKEASPNKEEKEISIGIDGKDFFSISREVNAAYIQNYRTIYLKGNELKTRIKEIQDIIQNLIALEIMEQTSTTITARDFLNMEKVSTSELIRKMDVVVRTIIKELINIFNEDNYDAIKERDKDVDRLYFLLYRTVLYNLQNPMQAIKTFKLESIDLVRIHNYGFNLEDLANEVRRAAKYSSRIKITSKQKKQIEDLFKRINEYYLQTAKAMHNHDLKLSLESSPLKRKFEKEINKLEEEWTSVKGISRVCNHLIRMVNLIHEIGRVVYTVN